MKKMYIFKHNPNPNPNHNAPPSPIPLPLGAFNSHTHNRLFEKIPDPPLPWFLVVLSFLGFKYSLCTYFEAYKRGYKITF